MDKRLPAGFWLACIALFVMGFAFTSGSRVIVNHTITREIVVPQTLVLFTDQQRINVFINELLTPREASCFKNILIHESHMNPLAKNPMSSASGVGQLLASTYSNLGLRKSNDALAQTVAALSYVGERFGSAGPCGAWKFWQKNGWY